LLVLGPPEDPLRLRLRLSLVPGWTRPRSGGDHLLHCPPLGCYLHGGVVVVIIVYLEWGSSSSSNTRPFWAQPNIRYIYINKMPRLGMGGAQVDAILVQAKPRTGGPKSWPSATSWRRVHWLIHPGVVATRRIVIASEEGGRPYHPFHPLP
jgi:hypothetical protein